ncbi:hypothetical protein J6590_064927 [Homalodisca vitripennis]|nr:hypothetical protein J6590_064927 [Homalodisca vitripennis]
MDLDHSTTPQWRVAPILCQSYQRPYVMDAFPADKIIPFNSGVLFTSLYDVTLLLVN